MTARLLKYALIVVLVFGGFYLLMVSGMSSGSGEVEIGPHKVISHRSDRVVNSAEDTKNMVVQPSPEFLIEYAIGDGQHGFDILRIQADGSGEYTYWERESEPTRQKQLTFEVSVAELEEICEQLNQSGFMALASEYHGDLLDGTQIAITVVTGQVEKEVYCDNHFPVEVVAVADYLEKQVIQPHRNRS
ncbi:hypothetical protein [Bremerella alba]|uniref:Uncharacterized protein n=1 Tax=Bremerella alba TaxID=980252 RepID=A0A7V8V4A5_9BACT|nr:hypothetical protein [Bremerella alba]MBA2114521.1 hypothetical protein [Bremerella alba]